MSQRSFGYWALTPQPSLEPGPTSPKLFAPQMPKPRFLSSWNDEVCQTASTPASVLLVRPFGSPLVPIAPTRRFSLTS